MAIYSGFFHWTWWFSIAVLNYQRVICHELRIWWASSYLEIDPFGSEEPEIPFLRGLYHHFTYITFHQRRGWALTPSFNYLRGNGIPFGNQTWPAGKSIRNRGFNRKIPLWRMYFPLPCLITGGYVTFTFVMFLCSLHWWGSLSSCTWTPCAWGNPWRLGTEKGPQVFAKFRGTR